MISFPVNPEKQKKLEERMKLLKVDERDLIEKFIKSGGKGGQNVNKVSTAVLLSYKPSGLEVKCSVYRTQGLNRYKARMILCDKIEEKNNSERGISDTHIQKIHKQKLKKLQKNRQKREIIEDLRLKELERMDIVE